MRDTQLPGNGTRPYASCSHFYDFEPNVVGKRAAVDEDATELIHPTLSWKAKTRVARFTLFTKEGADNKRSGQDVWEHNWTTNGGIRILRLRSIGPAGWSVATLKNLALLIAITLEQARLPNWIEKAMNLWRGKNGSQMTQPAKTKAHCWNSFAPRVRSTVRWGIWLIPGIKRLGAMLG